MAVNAALDRIDIGPEGTPPITIDATGMGLTTTLTDACRVPTLATIIVVPGASATTPPFWVTEATSTADDVQVAAYTAPVSTLPEASRTTAASGATSPIWIAELGAPVIANEAATVPVMVTAAVAVCVATPVAVHVAVMVAWPGATATTSPLGLPPVTLATPGC